jgi:O-antigen/teichoic acid export membrane protein
MIGAILNNIDEVGYYEQSQKIIRILLTIITAVGTVMLPRLANCFAEKNYEQIKRYMYKTFSFVFMLSFPLMFGIAVVSNNFSPLFFGKGYDKVPIIMQVLSPIVLFISISNITGTQYLISTKRQKEFTISVVVGAIVNFLLNLVFIYFYKSVGAAIATVIAELSVTLVQLYFVRKDFKLMEIIKLSKNYIIAGIIMLVTCYAIDYFITNRLLGLIFQVLCGALVYLIVLLILKDKFLFDTYEETIKKTFNKIKK